MDQVFESFSEEEKELRVVLAWIVYGYGKRMEAVDLEARWPLHVTQVSTGETSAFVIAPEGAAPPWFVLAPFYKGAIVDLVCARLGTGRYTTIDWRRRPHAEPTYWPKVVQDFLASRGLTPGPHFQNGWIKDQVKSLEEDERRRKHGDQGAE